MEEMRDRMFAGEKINITEVRLNNVISIGRNVFHSFSVQKCVCVLEAAKSVVKAETKLKDTGVLLTCACCMDSHKL